MAPPDRGSTSELVISWGDSGAIELDRRPAPPTATALGGRPEQLTDRGRAIYYPNNLEWFEHLHRRLTRLAARALRHHGVGRVVTGLALGWETALAEAADGLRVPYRVVLPYQGVQSCWHDYHRQRFARLAGKAEAVEVVCRGGHAPWKFRKAQLQRLAEADLLFTLWSDPDGDAQAIWRAAAHDGKQVVNLWVSWRRYSGLLSAAQA